MTVLHVNTIIVGKAVDDLQEIFEDFGESDHPNDRAREAEKGLALLAVLRAELRLEAPKKMTYSEWRQAIKKHCEQIVKNANGIQLGYYEDDLEHVCDLIEADAEGIKELLEKKP